MDVRQQRAGTHRFDSFAIPLTVAYRGSVKCVSPGRFFRVNGKW